MTTSPFPLSLPASVLKAAERLAKEDGVTLDQWISVAVAEKIGAVETASTFLAKRAGNAKPADMIAYLDRAPDRVPTPGDEP